MDIEVCSVILEDDLKDDEHDRCNGGSGRSREPGTPCKNGDWDRNLAWCSSFLSAVVGGIVWRREDGC